jgi:hypothetical protein
MDQVIYSNTTDGAGQQIGERSESERVFLFQNAFKYRKDFKGEMREQQYRYFTYTMSNGANISVSEAWRYYDYTDIDWY